MAPKEMTVGEAAAALGLDAVGDLNVVIRGVATPAAAREDQLALAMDPKYLPGLREGAARAAVTPPDTDPVEYSLQAAIYAPRARFAMAGVTALFAKDRRKPAGAHPSAIIEEGAEVDPTASVGPYAIISAGARVGANVQLAAHCFVGEGAEIGRDCLFHPGVRVGHDVKIGQRCIVHSNAVIGADGFSFVTPEPGSVESAREKGVVVEGAENRVWVRIASLGAVVVGDDVEIGAGSTIDRGTVADTRIGDGVKIDNMVQIGHNVVVGENSLLCGQSGLAGSTEVGARVVLGGQSGVGDHSKLGDDVVVMGASGVSGVIASRSVIGGTPAIPREEIAKQLLSLRRLPRALEELAKLKNRFSRNEPSG
ncbi:MAG: UDP-3-O-(3-hydroxymyristoyl)glucosamine N-acyltransferase [Neomegalonema sp.]|nr:UDP-3-O-(3-hydroxymyristoyl)glucosamine N-acyltransferase [Neomegalonema sp.]